jgi:hypothetical protein
MLIFFFFLLPPTPRRRFHLPLPLHIPMASTPQEIAASLSHFDNIIRGAIENGTIDETMAVIGRELVS